MLVNSSERSRILRLGLPLVATMCSAPIMGIIDVAMVGPLGTASVAAIGISTFVFFASVAVLWGMLPAVQSLVAYEVGKGLAKAGMSVACLALVICTVLSVAIALFMYWLAAPVSELLAANAEIANQLSLYLTVMTWCVPANAFFIAIDGYWQGHGHTKNVMVCSLIGQLLNIPLSLVLIYGLLWFEPMGITGAALGTVLANWAAVTIRLAWVKLDFTTLINAHITATVALLAKQGLATGSAELIMSMGWALAMGLTGLIGEEAQAISAVVIQLAIFSIVIGHAYGIAGGSLIGWSLAQGKPLAARRWGWKVAQVATATVFPIAMSYMFLGDYIVGLLVTNPALIAGAASVLAALSIGLLIDAIGVVLIRSMQVAGAATLAAPIQVASMMIFLPLAWFIGIYCEYGVVGFWFGFVLSRIAHTAVAAFIWRGNLWLRFGSAAVTPRRRQDNPLNDMGG